MKVFTIGFTKKSARTFFESIKANKIKTLIDIRLNNSSQLAGFSKGSDLEYFLSEICECDYKYEAIFAPTKELMDGIKSNKMSIEQFETEYAKLIEDRKAIFYFDEHYAISDSICLLCSEEKPEHCHRRVLAELICGHHDTSLKHL